MASLISFVDELELLGLLTAIVSVTFSKNKSEFQPFNFDR